jgi:methyl-accepting chemotaxis protein
MKVSIFERVIGQLGLVPRIILLAVMGVVVLGLSVTAVTIYLIRDNAAEAARERVDTNMKVAWSALHEKGQRFSIVDGKLLVGEHVLNGNFDVVDKVKLLVGGTATVFMGDLRVSTNVVKPDGTRAVGTTLARTAAYEAVFSRKAPFRGEVEILGQPYMTAYDPILDDGGNVIGVLFVGMRKADFLRAADQTTWTMVTATLVVSLLASVFSYLIARKTIALPLAAEISAMRELAAGNLSVEVSHAERRDEIGDMAEALCVFKASAVERERLETERHREQEARNRRQTAIEQLARDFNQSVQGVLQHVSTSAHQLRDSAGSMTAVARETSAQSNVVAAAAERASANVETVAAAADELAAAESEIARQVSRSSQIAANAAEEALRVNAIVTTLSEATGRIGEVIQLINDIAAQTNLLALNATIEAARAGEAGKGFAVVAGEVKHLATQTARATDDIVVQINAVQSVTKEAVSAISGIGHTIEAISESATAIASAVEEQTAATHEIARNVQQASEGTREVTQSITHVNRGASTTGSAAEQVYSTAEHLSRQSEELTAEVANFLRGIRDAGHS